MKKHMRLLAILMVAMMTIALVACNDPSEGTGTSTNPSGSVVTPGEDKVAPVITVSGVPETCKVGDEVTIPAATATDDVDGDISANIKVTVSQMKEDGVTVNRDLIYQKAGNVAQIFNAGSNKLLVYKIVYVVKDAAGNEAKKEFTLTAQADNETGTLSLNVPSLDGYIIEGKAGANVTLPSAIAIDQPGDVDISGLVTASLYEKVNGETAKVLFARWENFTEAKAVRIPAGEYVLVYSVKDAAGNAFETTYEIPVVIAQPDEVNLALDPSNFALDGKLGMSWINNFGLVSFGHTSALPNLDQTVGMTENVTKIHEQYVAITYNADSPGLNGQMFYSIAARGSKDRNTMPNKETCTWPSYLFLRISAGGVESRVEKGSDKEMTTIKAYKQSLVDGKDHTLYLQWKNVGESATDPNAAIYIYGWVDQTPAVGYDNADFIFKAVAGDSIAQGVLTHEIFEELWSENGAGWFSMDTYGNKTPYDDDHLRIKGLVIYDANETEFAVDITPPAVDVEFDASGVFATNEAITIPSATFAGETSRKVYMVLPDGSTVDVSGSYTPTVAGNYTLVYLAKDEAGNLGYREFGITVADRDEVAPELSISNDANMEANVGETVVLPTATANDAKDGNLDAAVTIEIIGTEHVTELKPGGNYTPMTAGVQTVIYRVSDSFGNVTEKSFTITVKSTTAGQLLTEPMGIGHPGKGLLTSQYVYDEKVSMLMNIEKYGSVIMFNLRGPVKNTEWPGGMVLRFDSDGITLSSHGHDSNIFGRTTWEFWKFRVGTDMLFEYQTKNVVIDGVEYIRVQAWINGKALKWTADASRGGVVGLEEGIDAIYRKVSDFTSDAAEANNIYSSPFFVAAYNSSVLIKELRMDGQSCTCPEDPKVPDGYQINFGSGHNFITEPVSIPGSGDNYTVIGQHSNEEYVAVTFKGAEAAKGGLTINLTGTAQGWSGGLFLRLSQDGFEIRVGGPNNDTATVRLTNGSIYSGGINDKEYTLVYKLTYIKDAYGYSTGIQVDVWLGEAGGTLKKCSFSSTNNNNLVSYDEATDAIVISSKAFVNAENMTPGKITVVTLEALNGTCPWTISKVETLAAAPNTEVKGWENILNDNPAQVQGSEAVSMPAGTDTVAKAVTNVNENYVAVTFKHNFADKHTLYINMTGTSGGWDGGIGLRLGTDGMYLNLNGVNATSLAQLNFYSLGAVDTEFTVVYKLTYLENNGKYYGVEIEIWAGPAGGTLTKVGCRAIKEASLCSYDEEKGAFVLKYDVVDSAEKFAPDCTVVALGAFNGDCTFTLTNVEVLAQAPGAAPEEVKGYDNFLTDNAPNVLVDSVTSTANGDTVVKLVENVGENYISITFKRNDIAKHTLCLNLTGSSGGWDGGIGLRLSTNDGMYLTVGGAQKQVAQLNFYGIGAADEEFTIVYKLSYLQTNGIITGAKVELWQGKADGTLSKVGLYALKDASKCSYDETDGAFIFNYDVVDSAEKFAPDCTAVVLGAFNPEAVFTITKVEVLTTAP